MARPKNKKMLNLEQRLDASKFENERLREQIDERDKWLNERRKEVWEKERTINQARAEKKWKRGNYEATFTVTVRVFAHDINEVEKLALKKAWKRFEHLNRQNETRQYGMNGWSKDVAESVGLEFLGGAVEIKKVK